MKIIGTIQVHDGIIDLKKIWNQVSIGHNHIDISLIILKREKRGWKIMFLEAIPLKSICKMGEQQNRYVSTKKISYPPQLQK